MRFNLIEDIYNQISTTLDTFVQGKKGLVDGYYVNGEKNILTNRINIYLDYLNFSEISKALTDKTAKNLDILDLGCGLGSKSVVMKKIFSNSKTYGLETTSNDDSNQKDNPPYKTYRELYPFMKDKFNLNLGFYDGINIPFDDNFFDIIVLYAVIEHIAPENRKVFIDTISKKLKKDGYIVITRCPRYWGLIEFISRKFKLGAHPWVLKKKELLGLFDKNKFSIEVFKRMNNIPNN